MKFLRVNLTKSVQDLYTGNYKMLLREIKEDVKKPKVIPSSWIRRLFRCQLSANLSVDSLAFQWKSLPLFFFVEITSHSTLGIYPWEKKSISPHKDLYINVQSNFICNSPKPETT